MPVATKAGAFPLGTAQLVTPGLPIAAAPVGQVLSPDQSKNPASPASPSPKSSSAPKNRVKAATSTPWWFYAAGGFAAVGAGFGLFQLGRRSVRPVAPGQPATSGLPAPEVPSQISVQPQGQAKNPRATVDRSVSSDRSNGAVYPGEKAAQNGSQAARLQASVVDATLATTVAAPAVSETTRLARINIVEELVKDLRNPDPVQRHKVIWELGQRGDTRAVQPLVDLMVDSDSRQSSLILSALSEIGTRTLKPMSRALALSLQNESSEVRKNAIRDLTRVYDLVAQISQLLHQATEDSDQEVQETARWALSKLNRIRSSASGDASRPILNSVSQPEQLRIEPEEGGSNGLGR